MNIKNRDGNTDIALAIAQKFDIVIMFCLLKFFSEILYHLYNVTSLQSPLFKKNLGRKKEKKMLHNVLVSHFANQVSIAP